MQSMTAMQNSISQLAQSICTRPPPGSKGQGKGRPSKDSKGRARVRKPPPGNARLPTSSPRRNEPNQQPKKSNARSVRTHTTGQPEWFAARAAASFPRGMPPEPPPLRKALARPASKLVGVHHLLALPREHLMPLLSKAKPARPRAPKRKKHTQQKKADSIEKLLATMDKDDPLREDLESQLEQLRAALKDPRNPGARLDSAMAKMRKAKAKVEKCQEQLRQAEASLKAAHAEEEEANSELKAAQANAVEAARQLAKEWDAFLMPQPIKRTRSMPPRESQSMMSESSTPESSPPRENPASQSQPDQPPRRRLRGKTPALSSPGSPPRFCPADSSHGIESQHSEGVPEPYGCWDEIYDVLRKPVLVDRHIPRELKTLWQRTVLQLLCAEQSRTDVYPIASDLVFTLPKLILSHPPGKEKAKERLHRIQECLRRASQGEWPYLIARTLEMDTPTFEPDERQPLATGPDSLPPRTARRLYKAASQGQLGKAWRQLRAPPPVHVGPRQWDEAVAKLTPHEQQEGSVPLREDIAPDRWHPTPREYNHAISKLKRNKAADAGGWTTETAQSCTDHTPETNHACLAACTCYSYLWTRPAERTLAHPSAGLPRQRGGRHTTHTHWDDLGQAPEPPTAATGQVRLGAILAAQAIWDRNPPGGTSYDYGH